MSFLCNFKNQGNSTIVIVLKLPAAGPLNTLKRSIQSIFMGIYEVFTKVFFIWLVLTKDGKLFHEYVKDVSSQLEQLPRNNFTKKNKNSLESTAAEKRFITVNLQRLARLLLKYPSDNM